MGDIMLRQREYRFIKLTEVEAFRKVVKDFSTYTAIREHLITPLRVDTIQVIVPAWHIEKLDAAAQHICKDVQIT